MSTPNSGVFMNSELNNIENVSPLASPHVVQFPSRFARDVTRGLTAPQKTLPSMYLYDAVGSMLFESICHLDVYHCTRAEKRILNERAAELAAMLSPNTEIAELGGGSGEKAAILLAKFRDVHFHNIDISSKAIELAQRSLSQLPSVTYSGYCADLLEGLSQVSNARNPGAPLLVLFLGGSIGNYDHEQVMHLLADIRDLLSPGDYLLLGTDLVKPIPQLLCAYDDPAGVTAAFNKNILVRMNRELGTDFHPNWFKHESRWNAEEQRIEMHLVATRDHGVTIPQPYTRIAFRAGESIHTENSHKYRPDEIRNWANAMHIELIAQWIDAEGLFATNLLRVS
jgi:L-histidine N-alpha-methyltransferase